MKVSRISTEKPVQRDCAESTLVPREPAIRVTGLSKRYHLYDKPRDRFKQLALGWHRTYARTLWALNEISFDVQRGETFGIIGCNGSGKSTLLQIIGGILAPTNGDVVVKGRMASLLELGSGFNPDFTGRENAYVNGAILGLSQQQIDACYDAIVEFAGIEDFMDQPVKNYSSGMLLRLAFAVAVNVEPDILLIDEALAVGDELFQRKCFARFRSLQAQGTTVLFVSHSGLQVQELCDRALLLDAGDCLGIGRPRDLLGLYRRMIFAPPAQRASIRDDIPKQMAALNRAEAAATVPDSQPAGRDIYEPDLKPLASVDYASHGARIEAVHLINEDGEKVNGLHRGRRYRCVFRVVFHRDVSDTRFGVSIHSKTGLHYAGALSRPEKTYVVAEQQTAQVEFAFNCDFNPGTYFIHVSAHGILDGDEMLLHRKEDACVFRVQPNPDNIETGAAYLAFEPAVTWQVT